MSFGFSKTVSRCLNVFEMSQLSMVDLVLCSLSFNALHSIASDPMVSISPCPSEMGKISSDSFKLLEQVLIDSSKTSNSYRII